MESEIQELAAAHAKAAIAVLVEIMKNPRVPSRERLSAAKALLERAFGKATGQKPKQEAPVTPVTLTIADPKPREKRPVPEKASGDPLPPRHDRPTDDGHEIQLFRNNESREGTPSAVHTLSNNPAT